MNFNEEPRSKLLGIEDFTLKSLSSRGNISPAPPVTAASCGVLNQRATPQNKICEEAFFQSVYDNAMREQEKSLREDNSSYELVDPAVGLQPTKKVVVMDPTDDRTEYIYPDGSNVTDWLPL